MRSHPAPHTFSKQEADSKLRRLGETSLLRYWDVLDPRQRSHLLTQIAQLDEALLAKQRAALSPSSLLPSPSYQPIAAPYVSGNRIDQQEGFALLRKGQGACIVLAGGQGSRLRCQGPKGCIPITRIKQKTLFQLLAEKVKAASEQADYPLSLAIMTSPLNHEATQYYFQEHNFFGLVHEQVHFFPQAMWPFLKESGHLFLETQSSIACGPNGNGAVLQRLVETGIATQWHKQGVVWVQVIPIDNPLALPFDPELFGLQQRTQSEVVVKTAWQRDREEKVGLLALSEGALSVLEYSELENHDINRALFSLANIGLYGFSMEFILRSAQASLRLHYAKKTTQELQENGVPAIPQQPNAWKFEEFIFDLFAFAHHYSVLLVPREREFAPLKNLRGEDSIETVQAALLAADRNAYAQVTGWQPDPNTVFELSPLFYYPTEALRARWSGCPPPVQQYLD